MQFSAEHLTKLQQIVEKTKGSLVEHFKAFHAGHDYCKEAAFHHEISDILLQGKGNFAVEAFRESAKSSLVLLDLPTYLLQFPDERLSYIVFIKQNQVLAEDKLRQAADAYLKHPVLSLNLVKVVRFSGKVFEAIVKNHKGEEVTMLFEAYGKGAAIRGLVHGAKRPHIVIIDDPQDFEDSRSDTTLRRDWEWFLSDIKNLGLNTRIFLIGNNLGKKCIIEKVFDHAEELGFTTLRIPALDEDNESTWEDKFSTEYLLQEKDNYRKIDQLDIWYRERMCEARSDENRDFKLSYFQYYDEPPPVAIKIALDPAISQKQDADYTGICVAGMSEDSKIYILETLKKKLKPDEIITELFSIVRKWQATGAVVEVGVEVVQYQKMLFLEIQKQMRLRNTMFLLTEIKPMGEKEARIRSALQARYAAKMVFHRPYMGDLEEELLSFPSGKNDDLIDATSYAVMLLNNKFGQKTTLTYTNVSKHNRVSSDFGELFSRKNKGISLRPNYGQ